MNQDYADTCNCAGTECTVVLTIMKPEQAQLPKLYW